MTDEHPAAADELTPLSTAEAMAVVILVAAVGAVLFAAVIAAVYVALSSAS